jgi:hypothetical protein
MVEEYSTRSEAQKATDALRIHVNKETPRSILQALNCEQLIAHYVERELAEDNDNRAYSTKAIQMLSGQLDTSSVANIFAG